MTANPKPQPIAPIRLPDTPGSGWPFVPLAKSPDVVVISTWRKS